MRPEASRKVVRVEPPEPPWLVEVPMTRPEASRIVERVIVPLFWWSMVCVTRPDESRTTSRQVWAGEGTTRIHDVASRGRDILIRASTDDDPKSFEEKITFRKPLSSSASLPAGISPPTSATAPDSWPSDGQGSCVPRWKAGDFAQEIQDIPLSLSHPRRQDFGITETKHRQIHSKCVHQKPGKSRHIAKILTVRFRSCYTSIFVVFPLPTASPCSSIPPRHRTSLRPQGRHHARRGRCSARTSLQAAPAPRRP